MTDDSTNEFDELLRTVAQDYNRPQEVRKDAIWERIRAERQSAMQRHTGVVTLAARRRRWLVGAAAAAALLILGIAIGRMYEQQARDRGRTDVAKLTPRAGVDTGNDVAPDSDSRDSAGIRGAAPSLVATTPRPSHSGPESGRSSGRQQRTGSEAPTVAAVDRSNTSSEDPRSRTGGSVAYRLAVLQHLAGTEAMLTSFRTAAKRGEVDKEITSWARGLLTTTRLLEASAAQQDPTMQRLLGDLELVLLQIAQYTTTGTHSAEELELIEHSIERRGVMGKIRTTIPARLTPAGT